MNDLKTYARTGLQAELARLDTRRTEVMAHLEQVEARGPQAQPRKRRMSVEGRERIREAVQCRWARGRAEQASADAPATTQEQASPSGGKLAARSRAVGNRNK